MMKTEMNKAKSIIHLKCGKSIVSRAYYKTICDCLESNPYRLKYLEVIELLTLDHDVEVQRNVFIPKSEIAYISNMVKKQ